jgi:hypothetical protein
VHRHLSIKTMTAGLKAGRIALSSIPPPEKAKMDRLFHGQGILIRASAHDERHPEFR